MEYRDLITTRHSSRDFDGRPIAPEILRTIVSEAQHAASWANAQPWQVVIATGETLAQIKRQHLTQSRQGVVGNADLTVAHRTEWPDAPRKNMATWSYELGNHLREAGVGQAGYSQTQDHLFNASALVYLVLQAPVNEWEVFDLGAFSQMLMLSATDHGIQSIPAYEVVRYPDTLRETFGLPETSRFMMGIALGYENRQPINDFRSSRVATKQILTLKD
ncbi:nitroreductase [Levilactobacillus cerevisiae]|uniref:nitroreductase n=1 Tax=Levilactobacillus cerevisiae TaxID=1704076 RepID=UPI000F776DE4|nr:nitroreductase [Levilactobacillus cerevisiae]